MRNVLFVAFVTAALPRRHWYVSGASPAAETLKPALFPCVTTRLLGGETIEGAVAANAASAIKKPTVQKEAHQSL